VRYDRRCSVLVARCLPGDLNMRTLRTTLHPVALCLALLCAALPAAARSHRHDALCDGQTGAACKSATPRRFDYYTLALSWSPTYCAQRPDDHDQCAAGSGYGFVLHGLWPQYESGWPQYCAGQPLNDALVARFAPLYPSPKLMRHEWRKHGTCSGLAPADYFALSGRLRESVRIPAQYQQPATTLRTRGAELVRAFARANPQLTDGAVLPVCRDGGRFLSEVRICFNPSGASRPCGTRQSASAAKSCRAATFLVPGVR
jgi:ribonuclease T2